MTFLEKPGSVVKINKMVIAEDDDDDFLIFEEAMLEAKSAFNYHRVKDGVELISFLLDQVSKGEEFTDMVLLDLNMPRKGGREALEEIKKNKDLKRIPILVFTTSSSEEDIELTYRLGGNSYVQKPQKFDDMIEFFKTVEEYWFHMTTLPNK